MCLSVSDRPTVVTQCMTLTDNLTLAFAPFSATEVAELETTDADHMIATSLFFDNVPTLKTSHPIHLPAELRYLVYDLCSAVLVLCAAHSFMPFRTTFETNCLLASWTPNGAGIQSAGHPM